MLKTKWMVFALVSVLAFVLAVSLAACAPHMSVIPSSVTQGTTFIITAADFQNGEKVTATIGAVTLGTATASSSGQFTIQKLKVPQDIKPGTVTLTVTGDKGSRVTYALTVK